MHVSGISRCNLCPTMTIGCPKNSRPKKVDWMAGEHDVEKEEYRVECRYDKESVNDVAMRTCDHDPV